METQHLFMKEMRLVFDLMVVLKKSDKTISSEKYRENYVAGDPVYLEIIPNGYELKKLRQFLEM